MLILMLLARVRNVMPRAFEIPLMFNELLVMHKIERQIPCKERDFWNSYPPASHMPSEGACLLIHFWKPVILAEQGFICSPELRAKGQGKNNLQELSLNTQNLLIWGKAWICPNFANLLQILSVYELKKGEERTWFCFLNTKAHFC